MMISSGSDDQTTCLISILCKEDIILITASVVSLSYLTSHNELILLSKAKILIFKFGLSVKV